MGSPYLDFKAITDKYYTDWKKPSEKALISILEKNKINLRRDDGELRQITFSVPTSKKNALVLGLRYEKRGGLFAEDLFLFEKSSDKIQPIYRGKYKKVLPEYVGTHRRSPTKD